MLKIYMYIALNASAVDTRLCKAGECCVSTRKIAEETGLSRQNVKTALKNLEKSALVGHYERGLKKANVYAIVPIESMQKSGLPPHPDSNPNYNPDKSARFSNQTCSFTSSSNPDFNQDSNHRYDNINNSCAVADATAQLSEEKEEWDGDMYSDYVYPWLRESTEGGGDTI